MYILSLHFREKHRKQEENIDARNWFQNIDVSIYIDVLSSTKSQVNLLTILK